MRVSEARDLGEIDRFTFYDHTKVYTAAPPDVLRVDEKHLREHYVFNVLGFIITTNHKTDGIYLPADDRRHFVAWSNRTKEDFAPDYWNELWGWYETGGFGHVAAYLGELDLSGFDPKAPPPKTPAFWDIVNASRAPEDAELADVLDALGNPDVTTLSQLIAKASGGSRRMADGPQEPARLPAPARALRLRRRAQPRSRRRALDRGRSASGHLRQGTTVSSRPATRGTRAGEQPDDGTVTTVKAVKAVKARDPLIILFKGYKILLPIAKCAREGGLKKE